MYRSQISYIMYIAYNLVAVVLRFLMITLISVTYYIRVPFYGLIEQNWFHMYLCPIAFFFLFFLLSWNILSSYVFFPLSIWTAFPRVFVGPFSCINCELRQNMCARQDKLAVVSGPSCCTILRPCSYFILLCLHPGSWTREALHHGKRSPMPAHI